MQCVDIIKAKSSFVYILSPTQADADCTLQNIDSEQSLNGDAI